MKFFKIKPQLTRSEFAIIIANHLQPGAPLALVGSFGSGKTTFCKSIIEFYFKKFNQIPPVVSSPSFALVHTYKSNEKNFEIHHIDLYRLEKDPDRIYQLNFSELLEGIALIEWPEPIMPHIKDIALILRFPPPIEFCDNPNQISCAEIMAYWNPKSSWNIILSENILDN